MVAFLNKSVIIIFITVYSLLNLTHGQDGDCVPNTKSINISSNATLWWEVDPGQSCEITSYKLDIVGDREDEYHFTLTENFIDLSFLEVCERWLFTVTPISHDVVGYKRMLDSYIPLPPDADLNLGSFHITVIGRDFLFAWNLRNQTFGDCTLEYRFVIEDTDRGTIDDLYVTSRYVLLDAISSCIQYRISIRAINQAHPTIEGPLTNLNLRVAAWVQYAPTLLSVDVQATSIKMTWALEGERNRCPLRTFYLDGGDYFQTNVSLQGLENPTTVSVEVTSLRPNSMYLMRASVENSAGWSPATPVAIQTLDLS